jgi:hypothetical protein
MMYAPSLRDRPARPPWTTLGLVRTSLYDIRRRPLAAVGVLGVLPTVWLLALNHGGQFFRRGAGFSSEVLAGGLQWLVTTTLWGLLIPVLIRVGLAMIRDGRIGEAWSRAAARSTLSGLAAVVSTSLLQHGMISALSWSREQGTAWGLALQLAVATISLYAGCRWALWVPLIVDKRMPFAAALKSSIVHTRGEVLRILRFMLVLGAPLLVLLMAFSRYPIVIDVIWVVASPVIILSFARLYCALCVSCDRDASL